MFSRLGYRGESLVFLGDLFWFSYCVSRKFRYMGRLRVFISSISK